ncbi:MAG TPA: PadR family transcriptional regulator, partial [Ktedonobacterales bacterium]
MSSAEPSSEAAGYDLPVSSYVILGLLATRASATPYLLKKWVDESISYFWDFPRAQLYIDPERLARLGLVAEERETSGRRRRVYRITEAGKAELRRWLRERAVTEVELRDQGLLKLFFGSLLSADDVRALAARERDLHRQRLATYLQIRAQIERDPYPDAEFALATLRMGVAYEEASLALWESLATTPPQATA